MSLRDFLIDINEERDNFLDKNNNLLDNRHLISSFFINLFFYIVLYNEHKDKAEIKRYLKQEKVRYNSITDGSNDLLWLTKHLADENIIPKNSVNLLTKFYALLKQEKINTIDESQIRDIFEKMKVQSMKFDNRIKSIVKKFIDAEFTVSQCIPTFYQFSKKHNLNDQLLKLIKKYKLINTDVIDDLKNQFSSDDNQDVQSDNQDNADDITQNVDLTGTINFENEFYKNVKNFDFENEVFTIKYLMNLFYNIKDLPLIEIKRFIKKLPLKPHEIRKEIKNSGYRFERLLSYQKQFIQKMKDENSINESTDNLYTPFIMENAMEWFSTPSGLFYQTYVSEYLKANQNSIIWYYENPNISKKVQVLKNNQYFTKDYLIKNYEKIIQIEKDYFKIPENEILFDTHGFQLEPNEILSIPFDQYSDIVFNHFKKDFLEQLFVKLKEDDNFEVLTELLNDIIQKRPEFENDVLNKSAVRGMLRSINKLLFDILTKQKIESNELKADYAYIQYLNTYVNENDTIENAYGIKYIKEQYGSLYKFYEKNNALKYLDDLNNIKYGMINLKFSEEVFEFINYTNDLNNKKNTLVFFDKIFKMAERYIIQSLIYTIKYLISKYNNFLSEFIEFVLDNPDNWDKFNKELFKVFYNLNNSDVIFNMIFNKLKSNLFVNFSKFSNKIKNTMWGNEVYMPLVNLFNDEFTPQQKIKLQIDHIQSCQKLGDDRSSFVFWLPDLTYENFKEVVNQIELQYLNSYLDNDYNSGLNLSSSEQKLLFDFKKQYIQEKLLLIDDEKLIPELNKRGNFIFSNNVNEELAQKYNNAFMKYVNDINDGDDSKLEKDLLQTLFYRNIGEKIYKFNPDFECIKEGIKYLNEYENEIIFDFMPDNLSDFSKKIIDETYDNVKDITKNLFERDKNWFKNSFRDKYFFDYLSLLMEHDIDKYSSFLDNIRSNYGFYIQKRKAVLDFAFLEKLIKNENSDLYNDVISPHKKLSKEELKELFKNNNFSVLDSDNDIRLKLKKNETTDQFVKRYLEVLDEKIGDSPSLPELKVQPIELTEEEKEFKTAEFAQYYSPKFTHGNIGIQILDSFNVNFNFPEFQEFKAQHPDATVIPAFHGTGSIAASFILRFGFAIVDQSLIKAGRMLGHGVYFSNIIDKCAQYIGDHKFTRRSGTEGYVFEMEAYLGEKGTNYRAAGLDKDHIKSPEWCVFDPRAQLNIVKVHRVKLVNKSYIMDLAKKHNIQNLQESEIMTFRNLINEVQNKQFNDCIHFIFRGGEIPYKNDLIEFEDFKKKIKNHPNIEIQVSQKGPILIIHNDIGLNEFNDITDVYDFMHKDPNGKYSQFKSLIKKYM